MKTEGHCIRINDCFLSALLIINENIYRLGFSPPPATASGEARGEGEPPLNKFSIFNPLFNKSIYIGGIYAFERPFFIRTHINEEMNFFLIFF
jgi:hypothetical protein